MGDSDLTTLISWDLWALWIEAANALNIKFVNFKFANLAPEDLSWTRMLEPAVSAEARPSS